jgi:hypothetical protein
VHKNHETALLCVLCGGLLRMNWLTTETRRTRRLHRENTGAKDERYRSDSDIERFELAGKL